MTAANDARQRYVDEFEFFRSAAEVLRKQLHAMCRQLGVGADITAREKQIGSFVKKIHLRKYTDPWAQITDKVGARIVVDSLTSVEEIRRRLEQQTPTDDGLTFFDVRDLALEADVKALFYPGVHAQVVIPGAQTSDGEPIEAEVQLRTTAQDAWSIASHKLVYKGVVDPGRQIRRRVLRLSVLIEMFDEEVGAAMNELASDPAYANAQLLHVAESEYLRFVAEPGEDELSLEVIDALSQALVDELTSYGALLRGFAEDNKEKLADIYSTYGVYSAFAGEFSYWLFSQPESLIVFHLIEQRPMALARAVRGSEIEGAVSRLFEGWGRQMPSAE